MEYRPETVAADEIEMKRIRKSVDSNKSNDDDDDLDEALHDPLARAASLDSDLDSDDGFQRYTVDEEKAVVRKLDRRLVLFMSFCYMLSFLDRSNIGNAKIAGLTKDLNLKGHQFDDLLTAFYVTYISFEWMILLYDVVPPHAYISLCVLSWGLTASLQALVSSFVPLLILRAILGIGEAAFSPGIPFYFSFFFKREELATRAGALIAAAPLASSFAGSLAWAITKASAASPIAPWRVLFLVEGFPSVIMAIVAWSFIPDSPDKAKFLTPRQRKIAKWRLAHGSLGEKKGAIEEKTQPTAAKHFAWREVGQALKDPKCYLTAMMFLCCNIAFSSMPVFLPTIIREMGYSSINSQALSAPPFLFSFVVVLVTAKLSDRAASRSPFVCFHALLGFSGYFLIALGGILRWGNVVRYLFVYPAAAGFFSAITIIITWTINNQDSNAKKGTGMTILNVFGQCGPLIGVRLYPDSDEPYYIKGMSVCAIAMLIVFILSLILRLLLARANRRSAEREQRGDDGAAEPLAGGARRSLSAERFVFIL